MVEPPSPGYDSKWVYHLPSAGQGDEDARVRLFLEPDDLPVQHPPAFQGPEAPGSGNDPRRGLRHVGISMQGSASGWRSWFVPHLRLKARPVPERRRRAILAKTLIFGDFLDVGRAREGPTL